MRGDGTRNMVAGCLTPISPGCRTARRGQPDGRRLPPVKDVVAHRLTGEDGYGTYHSGEDQARSRMVAGTFCGAGNPIRAASSVDQRNVGTCSTRT